MGAISMLHPEEPGLMISTRHSTMLARLDERGIVGGPLEEILLVAPLVNGRCTKFSLLLLQHSPLVVQQHAYTCKGHSQLRQVVRRTSFLSNQLTFSVRNTLARLSLSILTMMLQMNSSPGRRSLATGWHALCCSSRSWSLRCWRLTLTKPWLMQPCLSIPCKSFTCSTGQSQNLGISCISANLDEVFEHLFAEL